MANGSSLQLASGFLKRHKLRFALAVFWSVVFIVVPMQIPILTGALVDALDGKSVSLYGVIELGQSPEHVLTVIIVSLLSVALLYGVSGYLRALSIAGISRKFVSELRKSLVNKIDSMSLGLHHSYGPAELLNRTVIDTRSMRRFIESVYIKSATNVLRVIYPVAALFILDPVLALITCSVVPVQWFITARLQKKLHKASKKQRSTQAEMTAAIKENIDGIETVKTSGFERDEIEKLCKKSEQLESDALNSKRYSGMITASTWALTTAGLTLTWWQGGLRVMSGEMTIGTLVIFTGLAVFVYAPFRRFTSITNVYHTGIVALDRIGGLLSESEELKDEAHARQLNIEPSTIEFKDVSFSYGGSAAENILEDVSFRIEDGELSALVGKSGCGKSSILKLIPRLYDPKKGQVLVGDVDVKSYTQESLRSQIAVVPQHPFMFSGTAKENITLTNTQASDAEVREACEMSSALEFIEGLEEGFDTLLGQGGIVLSGGQINRIAIARALLRKPKILLLDEPASGLDAEAEAELLRALRALKGKMTIVVAGHSPRAIQNADRVIVIDEGKVVKEGTSRELISPVGQEKTINSEEGEGNEKSIGY